MTMSKLRRSSSRGMFNEKKTTGLQRDQQKNILLLYRKSGVAVNYDGEPAEESKIPFYPTVRV